MRFSFTPEQEEFRSSLRRALEARSPTKEVRRLMATDAGLRARRLEEAEPGTGPHRRPYSRGLWRQRLRLRPSSRIVLEEMGRGAAVRALLLVGGAGRQRHPECRHGSAEAARCCPAIAVGRDDRDPGLLRGRRRATTPRASRMTATQSGSAWRLDGTQELRARRPHRRPHRRAGAPAGLAAARTACRSSPSTAMRRAWSGGALKTMDETRKLARLELQGRRGASCSARPARRRRRSRRPCSRPPILPRQRDGRRRRAAARGCARLRQDAHAVRPADRLVPDDQAQGGRHAGRCRAGEVGGLLRRRRARRGRRRPAGDRLARQGRAPPRPTCRPAIHAVQMHGGIGFTWDNDTHLWFKRAKS